MVAVGFRVFCGNFNRCRNHCSVYGRFLALCSAPTFDMVRRVGLNFVPVVGYVGGSSCHDATFPYATDHISGLFFAFTSANC